MEPNDFFAGDIVRLKAKPSRAMKVTSNVPGGGIGSDPLQNNKFNCDWLENGVVTSKIFHGSELQLVMRG